MFAFLVNLRVLSVKLKRNVYPAVKDSTGTKDNVKFHAQEECILTIIQELVMIVVFHA